MPRLSQALPKFQRLNHQQHEECHCEDKDLRNAKQEFLEHALIYDHMEWIMKELNKLRFDSIEDVLDFAIANARAYNEYEKTETMVENKAKFSAYFFLV